MMSTPSTLALGKSSASREAPSPVPHPASSMRGSAGSAYRRMSGISCGQMACSCACEKRRQLYGTTGFAKFKGPVVSLLHGEAHRLDEDRVARLNGHVVIARLHGGHFEHDLVRRLSDDGGLVIVLIVR